ncbi:hypothetical protein D3C78_858840 [compost metagenome]
MRLDHRGDLPERVENARAGLAVDQEHRGDVRVVTQQLVDLLRLRRQVVALVQADVGAPEVVEGLPGALAVGAVHQHQRLAVARHRGGQRRLDGEGAAALHGHADIAVVLHPGHRHQLATDLGGDLVELAVPRTPVAQHGLLGGQRGGQRARGQQEGFALRRGGQRLMRGDEFGFAHDRLRVLVGRSG